MQPQTIVWILHPQAASYMVAESPAEVVERWKGAQQNIFDDVPGVVELTNVPGYFDPYPVAFNPGHISHVEEAPPLMVQYSHMKTAEKWWATKKELDGPPMGFSSK